MMLYIQCSLSSPVHPYPICSKVQGGGGGGSHAKNYKRTRLFSEGAVCVYFPVGELVVFYSLIKFG